MFVLESGRRESAALFRHALAANNQILPMWGGNLWAIQHPTLNLLSP
jgi:hypothetical protein